MRGLDGEGCTRKLLLIRWLQVVGLDIAGVYDAE
jgi:hypothetical protein